MSPNQNLLLVGLAYPAVNGCGFLIVRSRILPSPVPILFFFFFAFVAPLLVGGTVLAFHLERGVKFHLAALVGFLSMLLVALSINLYFLANIIAAP